MFMLSVCSFVLFLKFCMEVLETTGPGKVPDRNPADLDIVAVQHQEEYLPQWLLSPPILTFFALPTQKILPIKH